MNITRLSFHSKAHYYLAISIALCLPFARLTPILILLFIINWLAEKDFKNKFSVLIKNKMALLFISFYLIHLVGLIYTQNLDSGLFDIQVKLSLLIFPLIFGTRPLDKKTNGHIFIAFIAGGLLSSVMMLTRALYLYVTFGENNFFYQAFSFLIHPSYLSMYINVAIGWLLLNVMQRNFSTIRFFKLYTFLIIVFFSFIIVLLSSKMGLISMLLMYFGMLAYYTLNRKKYLLGISGFILIFLSIFLVFQFVPEVSGRIKRGISAITTNDVKVVDSESTAVRLLIWKASNQIISENLIWGVGTGDTKDVLMEEYQRQGMSGAFEHKLNTHSAFYQVFVSLGLIGFLLFLAILLLPLYYAFKTSNGIYFLFLIIIILNFIAESMLETQAGVIFYAFFNSLLYFSFNPIRKISNLKT